MAAILLSAVSLNACTASVDEPSPAVPSTHPETIPTPDSEPPPLPPESTPVSPSPTEETPPQEPIDEFTIWWEEFKQPFTLDSSTYPEFYRGAYGSRLDELRSYLLNADKLREAGFDSVMLGVDVVFDPVTGEAKSLSDDLFIFYLQALKKEGFRIIIIPNPMHPNLDMGLGYEWEDPDPNAGYHRSYELIHKIDPIVLKWAKVAAEYGADVFAPSNEPYKLVRDYQDAGRWLQEILPQIKEVYSGPVWVVDTMHDIGPGQCVPYPYDYTGYDRILCGPPAGWKNISAWEQMYCGYLQAGSEYVIDYNLEGFGLYECGAYTGGIWYEDGLAAFDQIMTQAQAGEIAAVMVSQANGMVNACFPRVSTGWIDPDTPAFDIVSEWYLRIGDVISAVERSEWTYDELIEIEQKLGGDDYHHIFQIFEISDTAQQ